MFSAFAAYGFGGSSGGGGSVEVNAPLYIQDGAITLNQASAINSGYLSASDYSTIMNGLLWQQSSVVISGITYNTINPVSNRTINVTGNLIQPNGSVTVRQEGAGSGVDLSIYSIMMSNNDQSVAIGSRGLAYRKYAGLWTYSGFGESVAIGEFALGSVTTANRNTCIGKAAGYSITTGVQNVVIGANRTEIQTGSNNVQIGFGSSSFPNHSGNFNIAIGAGINLVNPISNNQLNIGGWIYGTDGAIGIGVNNPVERLEINGNIKTATFGAGNGAWKLGKQVAAVVAFDGTQYIEVQVDGVTYKLALAA